VGVGGSQRFLGFGGRGGVATIYQNCELAAGSRPAACLLSEVMGMLFGGDARGDEENKEKRRRTYLRTFFGFFFEDALAVVFELPIQGKKKKKKGVLRRPRPLPSACSLPARTAQLLRTRCHPCRMDQTMTMSLPAPKKARKKLGSISDKGITRTAQISSFCDSETACMNPLSPVGAHHRSEVCMCKGHRSESLLHTCQADFHQIYCTLAASTCIVLSIPWRPMTKALTYRGSDGNKAHASE
jgi:hypothetical protein